MEKTEAIRQELLAIQQQIASIRGLLASSSLHRRRSVGYTLRAMAREAASLLAQLDEFPEMAHQGRRTGAHTPSARHGRPKHHTGAMKPA
jgi:hypothetical protein